MLTPNKTSSQYVGLGRQHHFSAEGKFRAPGSCAFTISFRYRQIRKMTNFILRYSNENRTTEHIVYLCAFVYPFKLLSYEFLLYIMYVLFLFCVFKFWSAISFIGCSFFRMEKWMMESNKVKYKKLTAKYKVLKRYWNLPKIL